ncbi:Flp pilus assembly protein CpaB [Burkholderiaceae bacterium FT117]|uniref:Flp pilus assembly protein CpaB n=1 Tax=Zeimonas sediminis TaxID=2944268 RepID=UPI002343011C|nr:Flp pilus assembly protein CpaB [Zeimonas sediminis]MCM5572086.1 Flp pilus assembly protein CpaB [Zeimonas sediminis]
MRGSRAVIMLVLALVAGIAAVVLAARWLSQQTSTATEVVIVAARDVNLGTPLNAAMLEVVPWPAGAVPTGAFRNRADLEGRVLLTSLQRGEPVLEGKLAPVGTRGGLSAVIPEGKRAITVRVNEVVGVAGFALPGNYVDVMVNTQDEQQKPISKIVLERILVLAVAQEASRDETKPKVVNAVTLEVTPEEAERLDLARSVGSLSLVLRNQVDQNPSATEGITKRELLGQTPPPPPPPVAVAPAPAPKPKPRPPRIVRQPAPQPETVEVIRGVQRSTAQF